MSVYARRRLLAAALIALVAVVAAIAVVLALSGGGGNSPNGPIGGAAGDGTPASAKVGPELAAHPRRTLPPPAKTVEGDGPIFEVRAGAIARITVPYPRGRVALTFDDGPGPYTRQILNELVALHAGATFFVIGKNAKASPDTVRLLRAAGMVVGNHTWTHPRMSKFDLANQRAQIRRTQDLLEATIGQRPRFFRPPMWYWNRTTAQAVAEEGMQGVLFSIDTRDWEKPGVVAIVRRALKATDGQIIALHDAGGDREETLQALPLIVKGLRARGLEPVTLDELFRAGRPRSRTAQS